MSSFFVDTSALAKRYLAEVGSMWTLSWIEPAAGNVTFVSELAVVEMRSLLERRVREKALALAGAAVLKADFLLHYSKQYLPVLLDTNIIQAAGRLTDTHPLRALDAIQIASALHAVNLLGEPMTFVSADKNLLTAASAEGFTTDNPLMHP